MAQSMMSSVWKGYRTIIVYSIMMLQSSLCMLYTEIPPPSSQHTACVNWLRRTI